jgi:uncharacterized Zn finger protein
MARRALGGLLLQLEAEHLDDAGFLTLCRQSGRTLELVRRLVQRGRMEEAVNEASHADTCDLVKIANLLVRHRYSETAAQLVQRCYQTTHPETPLKEWLARYDAGRRQQHQVLTLTGELFRLQPDTEIYRRLRQLGRQLGVWDRLHAELLNYLEQAGHLRLLVAIHLDENDIDRALELAASPSLQAGGLSLEVARAAEHSRPDEAQEIYRAHAERLLRQPQGENYGEACLYLRKVRALMRRTGGVQNWTNYIAALREQYGSVKPLLSALDAAQL